MKLIGSDVLPDDQKLILEIARVIRLGFLQQNAFHKDDTCVSMREANTRSSVVQAGAGPCDHGASHIRAEIREYIERVIAIKYDVPNDRLEMFAQYRRDIDSFYQRVLEKNA